MKKGLFRKGIVLGIIMLFVWAGVIPIISGYNIESSLTSNNSRYNKKVNTKGEADQIDQSQINIGNVGQRIRDNIWGAQSFKPTLNGLTRVFLALSKDGNPPNDFLISIRDSLSGPELTSILIPKNQISTYPDINWSEADFDDINIIPQKSYYIVASTIGGDSSNQYTWWGSSGNPYTAGESWYSIDYGYQWGLLFDVDFCFKTYGRDNLPPDAPTIDGPPSGKVKKKYEYTFNAVDPDGDDVKYFIDWGDNNTECTGLNASGTDVKVKHIWSEEGNYTIKVKTVDIFGAESNWSYFDIEIPRTRESTYLWYHWFLNHFPLLERMLNLLR